VTEHVCPLCSDAKFEPLVVHHATGMIMARFKLDAHDALVKLDRLAHDQSVPRVEAAELLVAGRFDR
jgi:hypothetical protein